MCRVTIRARSSSRKYLGEGGRREVGGEGRRGREEGEGGGGGRREGGRRGREEVEEGEGMKE